MPSIGLLTDISPLVNAIVAGDSDQIIDAALKLVEQGADPGELIASAIDSSEKGSRLAELYLERGYKLLDEEYAEIPDVERAIRELQQT
jgi:hypothetical protein